MDKKLQEGQKLWWVYSSNRRGQPREVTITKVGRKWAQLDNDKRIDLETLVADAGQYSPSGCCYLSREEYEQAEALAKAWSNLKRDLQYARRPDGVTIGDIEAARQMLWLPSNAALTGKPRTED